MVIFLRNTEGFVLSNMSDIDLSKALEVHAEADAQAFERFDNRFESLNDKIDNNHKELLVAITEMKTEQKTAANSAGIKSGFFTAGLATALLEAIKAVFTK